MKEVGKNVKFERIRRITGYLVGSLDRFNNGKKSEVEDRVKHSLKR
ncbi:MAG: ribonucleoside-triphosphate reductase [Fastidiosipila sp.]|nr:ribonucleoside-triphosphate reductase [Fastidiosipila sp.]